MYMAEWIYFLSENPQTDHNTWEVPKDIPSQKQKNMCIIKKDSGGNPL